MVAGTSGLQAVAIDGTLSVSSDFCTFSGGTTDYCWIPEGQFQISNNGISRLDDVVLQIDFYNCDGIPKDSRNASRCKPASRIHMVCKGMYIDAGTKAGCTAKSYQRGRKPWNDGWMWTVRAVS
jgi:hypothetical protein